MLQKSRELLYSVIAMVFITLGYLVVQGVYKEVPSASSLWGHSIGVIGFLMMLMTETLYSLRKRTNRSRWGKMSQWLEFHIFTGLVGPFMVLLHPGWQFKGLAGVLSLLTILIVISGFIGRYIYTAIPRTTDGVEITLDELEKQAGEIEFALEQLSGDADTQPANPKGRLMVELASGSVKKTLNTSATHNASVARLVAGTHNPRQTQSRLKLERDRLRRIIARRQASRRLFSLWHTIHIPLGLTLFTIAFIHIGAAIYFAMLLR